MNENLNEKIYSGIHPLADKKVIHFSEQEQAIINIFKRFWYVTKADSIELGASQYNYILIKAPSALAEEFCLFSEISVIFSAYSDFEPRTLDAFDFLRRKHEPGRIEKLCGVLVSKNEDICKNIKSYLSEQEIQIIVPFSYHEFSGIISDNYIFRNKFREYFYKRDLFAFNNPLKTDIYFFGRSQIVIDIINKHFQGQNSGLFGLRKTGKTSIVFDVQRKLSIKNSHGVFIDCQNPSMNQRRWNRALFYVLQEIFNDFKAEISFSENEFTEINAAEKFEFYLKKLYNKYHQSILVLFDEIENISFEKSPNDFWCKGTDFILFWQAIRSIYQKNDKIFTFCVIGTNPRCIEVPSFLGKDNPIFNLVSPIYIPGFDAQQTREMVRKLGRIMGIKFDETLYGKMTEAYGGHPFLIRHLCSTIANLYKERPIQINRIQYNKAVSEFNNNHSDYFDMLIDVLKQFYPDEYEMLICLAQNDLDTFNYFANEDYSFVKHLIGYGIIFKSDSVYDFKIDAVKDYLNKKKYSFQKTNGKEEDKYMENKANILVNGNGNIINNNSDGNINTSTSSDSSSDLLSLVLDLQKIQDDALRNQAMSIVELMKKDDKKNWRTHFTKLLELGGKVVSVVLPLYTKLMQNGTL